MTRGQESRNALQGLRSLDFRLRKALEGSCQGYEVPRSVFLKSHSDGQVEGERPGKGQMLLRKQLRSPE